MTDSAQSTAVRGCSGTQECVESHDHTMNTVDTTSSDARIITLLDLPYELLVKILGHLWPDELYTCMEVCTSLRQVAQDAALWIHLDLHRVRQCRHRVLKSTEGLLTLLRHSPQLRTLRGVDTFPFVESYLKKVKKYCPQLKCFDVGYVELLNKNMAMCGTRSRNSFFFGIFIADYA